MSLLAADPLLSALLTIVVLGTVLAGVAWLALLLLRRRSAAVRESLALAAIVSIVALPFAHGAAQWLGLGVPLWTAPASAAVPDDPMPDDTAAAAGPGPLAHVTSAKRPVAAEVLESHSSNGAPASRPAPARAWQPTAGTTLLAAWLAFCVVRLVVDVRRGRRLVRATAALPAADPALQRLLTRVAAELGLARVPPLHASDAAVCPATVGASRPHLLVPAALLRDHGEGAAAAMLRHECAHLLLGHHRHALGVLLARAVFGWHPLVHALLAEHAAAQEDGADNAAASGGAGVLYARSLVTLAERAAAHRIECAAAAHAASPLSLSALGRSPLRHRIQRLLAEEIEPMKTPSLLHRTPSFAAAVLATAATALITLAPAQDAARAPFAQSGAAFLPLQSGTAWTYRVTTTRADEDPSVVEEVVWDWGSVPAPDGACEQWLVTRGDTEWVQPQYWSADATGVHEHDTMYTAGIRGVGTERTRLLPAPVGAETRWTWTYQLAYQTEGDVERDPDFDRVHCTGELVAPEAEVAVPAGAFRAAHVRIRSTCKHWEGEQVRELWFARGTGIVKEIVKYPQGAQVVRELTVHSPSRVGAVDDETALRQHLQRDARSGAGEAEVQWLERGAEACYLRGRFAVATFAGGARDAFFVENGAVTPIGVDDLAFWRARAEQWNAPPPVRPRPRERRPAQRGEAAGAEEVVIQELVLDDVTGSDFALTFLTAVYGRVEGARQGLARFESAGSSSETAFGKAPSTTCTVRFDCVDGAGAPKRLVAVLRESDGKLQAINTSVGPRPEKGQQERQEAAPIDEIGPAPRGR